MFKSLNIILMSIIINALLLIIGCSSTPQYISPLPLSKEATCIESIAGKGYKYLAWGIGEDNSLAEYDALKAALWAALVGGGAGNCQRSDNSPVKS
jgi:hypothetical protein